MCVVDYQERRPFAPSPAPCKQVKSSSYETSYFCTMLCIWVVRFSMTILTQVQGFRDPSVVYGHDIGHPACISVEEHHTPRLNYTVRKYWPSSDSQVPAFIENTLGGSSVRYIAILVVPVHATSSVLCCFRVQQFRADTRVAFFLGFTSFFPHRIFRVRKGGGEASF